MAALGALALAGWIFVLGIGAAPAAVTIGQKAPAFTARAADGAAVSLKDLSGKVVVLEWFNKGCPFVRKHYDSGNMQALQKEYGAKGVVWLTVVSSAEGQQGYETPKEALETVKAEKAAPAHVLLDPEGTLGKLYGAKSTPHMFVIDADGNLDYAGAIDDTPSTDVADIKTADNYVREALDAILAGKPVTVASTTAYGCSVKYKN
jgi:peroxiredoxin